MVVITGASSGIGRGAARAFAARGDDVVLVARNARALEALAADLRTLPARTIVAPADVTDEEAVIAVARRAVAELGRIDAWVNGAAVWSFGTFEDTPSDVFRRVLETTLLGAVHGARAALPVFRSQGSGVLVNVASVYGHISTPYVSPYVSAKWALVGLSNVLRQELADAPGIAVSIVSPGAVDTPIYQHGANYIGRSPRPLPPALPTERVVRAIVRAVDRPRREVFVGRVHRMGITAQHVAPDVYDRIVGPVMDHLALQRSASAAHTGNVYQPDDELTGTDGGWRRHDARIALKTSLAAGAAVAGAMAAAVAWRRRG